MAKLKIDRGTTYTRTGTFSVDGVLTSLVGATVRFTVKTNEYTDVDNDSDASILKNITTGTSDGAYTITISPSDTQDLDPGKYYYSTKVDVNSDGDTVYLLDEGTVELAGDPTNRLS